MSAAELLRSVAHQGYPSSGEPYEGNGADQEPFGPGGDTTLSGAARPVTIYGFSLPPVRPTETQAARAETRTMAALEVEPGGVSSIPVITTDLLEKHRAAQTDRAPDVAGATRSMPQTARRRPADSPVERPETVAPSQPSTATAQPTASVPRAVYPATRSRAVQGSKHVLRALVRPEAAPTAPMRVVDRLTATPFQHLRKFGDSTDKQARRTLNFALRIAETMFHYGADSLDVENAVIAVCATYGVENLEVDITNQSVTINYVAETTDTGRLVATGLMPRVPAPDASSSPVTGNRRAAGDQEEPPARTSRDVLDDPHTTSHTVMRVVRSWTDNYAGLAESHQLVTRIIEGRTPLRVAEKELDRISARPKPYSRWVVRGATVAAAGTLTVGLGGSVAGAFVGMFSAVLVQVASVKLAQWRVPEFFSLAASALIVTLSALLVSEAGVELYSPRVIAAGLLMLLPTTRMVSTLQDAINGFPVTAAGRAVSSAMAFLGIVAGIALGISVAGYLGVTRVDISQAAFLPPKPWINVVFMLVSTALIAVVYQVKTRHIPPAVAAAVAGLLLFHTAQYLGMGIRLTTGLSAIVSGSVGALLAARLKVPQAILVIPGMMYLLPGLSIFRGMYAVTVENEVTGTGVVGLVNAMASILMMATGVVLSRYLMRPFIEHMETLALRRNRRR